MFSSSNPCISMRRESKIKLGENKSIFYIENKSNQSISVLKIDDCAIATGKRCDYGVEINKSITLLIELKGCRIDEAVKQLSATLASGIRNNQKIDACYIISSNNPLTSSASHVCKTKFMKTHRCPLYIERSGYTYK